jgi:hypothetical protein
MAASPSRKPDDSDSRLERFRTFTVAHPRRVEAKEALVNAIRGAEPNSLIFVFGPTGVGKTTLRLKTGQLMTAEMLSELREDCTRIPVVNVEAVRTAPPRGWTLLRPRRPAEIYDASLSFRSAMHFQTTYFANAGRGACCVSSNGARTDRSYMSRFSGQSRWHHIARSTPDRSIAFAAIVHAASARSAYSPGRDTARSATVGWANRTLIANRRAPVWRPLKITYGRAPRWKVCWRCFRRSTQRLPGSRCV